LEVTNKQQTPITTTSKVEEEEASKRLANRGRPTKANKQQDQKESPPNIRYRYRKYPYIRRTIDRYRYILYTRVSRF
jgi:hypothetical protein